MDKFKSVLSGILAVISMLLATLNITGRGVPEINYGGIPYEEKNITSWLTIIDDESSDYEIIRGKNCSESEKTAASELQNYLAQISGVILPIQTDDAKAPDNTEICVGKTNRESTYYTVDRDALGDEGFIIKVYGERLVIAGGELRGTLYGVYGFLEEQLNCRWFTQTLSVIPNDDVIKIDAELDDTQIPKFEYRENYWFSAFNEDYKAKHKLNNGRMSTKYGGGVFYADFCHSMERMVPDSYYESDPEYFSYREDQGIRTKGQRCLTNPDVLAITIANAKKSIDNNPGASIMSITQNDNGEYCQCANCKASDDKYGGPSGTNLWFANKVAEALEDLPVYKDVTIDTFAYTYTRPAPKNIKAHKNVVVRFCTIESCFIHPIAECGHNRHEGITNYSIENKNSQMKKDMAEWQEVCQRLYVWDYTTNFLYYILPHPNFQVLQPNMEFFVDNNVVGIFEQGNNTKSAEFGELRAYIIAKLLWNPNADVEYHMMDFMNAYYGKESAKYIRQYIDLITDKAMTTTHMYIFNWHNELFWLMPTEVLECDRLWKQAKENAANETELANIRRSELSYRFYKSNLMMSEFAPWKILGRPREIEKLYFDIVSFDITQIQEFSVLKKPTSFFKAPYTWIDNE